MISRQIRPGLWYIGAAEDKLRTFGNVSFTEAGMMYNSYLMDTGEGFLLFGALPERYGAEWIAKIRRIAGGNKIGWAVLFGTDNDRAAAKILLRESPETVLIGGTNALYRLEGFVESGEEHFQKIEIRSHRSLILGKRKLRFQVIADKFNTPSVYAVEQEEGILLTADAFGALYAPPQSAAEASDEILLTSQLSDRDAYFRGVKQYYGEIFGEKREKSLKAAADLVREAHINLICPACGPVADCEIDRLISVFVPKEEETSKVPVLAIAYAAGSYTSELAEVIEAGVKDSGNIAVERYDLSAMSRDQALRGISRCDAFLFGTPQVRQDAAKSVWDIVTSLQREDCQGKPAAVFLSAEARGSAAENLRQRLAMLGCDGNLRDWLVQGKPDLQALKNAYEYGFGLGCSIQKIPNPHKPTLVKCLVCGEIFDASLGICPVCGVGLEQCVPVDEEDVLFLSSTKNRYVVVGGGIAAVSAAEAIRRRDETGSIVMISAENYLPINRPMLTKDLDTVEEMPDTLFVHGQDWYDERRIELRLGCRVTALDVKNKTVTVEPADTEGNPDQNKISENERLPYIISYDKLIYAAGAECFVPPFEGHDKEGVLTIRHLKDSRKLQELLKTAKNAVIIGGGVLGLEAASELMRSGLKVTVLEATPQIIGRQVDAATASILKQKMEDMHVDCHEGVSIAGIEGEERATGVRLADGRVFPADFVIVSCGNRGNVQAAKEAGIAVERSIVVNQRMETSAADVYACGDCAQFDGWNFQLWQEASNQGRVAGANAAGERITYANQLLGLSLEGFGTTLFAIGDAGKKEGVPYKTVETSDGVSGRHEKYWFYGSSLQGAVVIGAPEKTAEISRAVTAHAEYRELFK